MRRDSPWPVQSTAGNLMIDGGSGGSITASVLSGNAVAPTTLGTARVHMANHVGTIGDFSSPRGFSFTDDRTLTLSWVADSYSEPCTAMAMNHPNSIVPPGILLPPDQLLCTQDMNESTDCPREPSVFASP